MRESAQQLRLGAWTVRRSTSKQSRPVPSGKLPNLVGVIVTDSCSFRHLQVAFALEARTNPVPLRELGTAGMCGNCDKEAIMLLHPRGRQVGHAKAAKGLYHIQLAKVPDDRRDTQPVAAVIDLDDEVRTRHHKLGHLSLLSMTTGISLADAQIKAELGAICPICATSRAVTTIPRALATRPCDNLGKLIHIDNWGPYFITGYDGTKWMTFSWTTLAEPEFIDTMINRSALTRVVSN